MESIYQELLEEARNNRTSDNFDQYLKNYDELFTHMEDYEVCIEVLLGDIYLEATDHADKIMRFRNPPEHPRSLLAELYNLVFRTSEKEFRKEFPKWVEKRGRDKAALTCSKLLEDVKKGVLISMDEPWNYISGRYPLMDYYPKIISALALFDMEPVYQTLEQLHKIGDKKIYGFGPYWQTLATTCIKTLEKLGTRRALQSLYRIGRYARYSRPDKAITMMLSKLVLSEDEIEDLKAPTFEFDQNLSRVETVNDLTITMQIQSDYKIAWRIVNEDGNEYSNLSDSPLKEYQDELKEMKLLEKTIIQELRYQRDRIEKTYRTGKVWTYSNWFESTLKHPIRGYSARRLIWEFTGPAGKLITGICSVQRSKNDQETDNQLELTDSQGHPLLKMDDNWQVKLWHPVEATQQERDAWKNLVVDLKIVQPFKQAFRETYTVTQPELQTKTFSNRFAAHILFKQQCLSIASGIGWTVPSISSFYSDCFDNFFYTSILGHKIDFVVEFEHGSGTNMSTDKVIFDQGAELVSIPPLVFSEAMRDIDLFVSVCSIGIDPTWTPDRVGYAYWTQYSTGDLSESAKNRKEVLQRILPALAIAQRCSIVDRWVYVEGDLCKYKIHIGSGSVHLEPSNQHLCIVPKAAEKAEVGNIYLPFEGDMMLSLILSKVFLLANDTKISDRTILRQLKSPAP